MTKCLCGCGKESGEKMYFNKAHGDAFRGKRWAKNNPEAHAARALAWYHKHKDKVNAQRRARHNGEQLEVIPAKKPTTTHHRYPPFGVCPCRACREAARQKAYQMTAAALSGD
jgi:hypothetical protein